MKYLKSVLLAVIITAAFNTQSHPIKLTTEERALVLTFRMSKFLQLSEVQKAEVMKIHQNAFDKMELAHQKFREDKVMLKKSRKEIFETRNSELEKVLTKEQFDIYKQKQKEIQEERRKEYQARKAKKELKNGIKAPANKTDNQDSAPVNK